MSYTILVKFETKHMLEISLNLCERINFSKLLGRLN